MEVSDEEKERKLKQELLEVENRKSQLMTNSAQVAPASAPNANTANNNNTSAANQLTNGLHGQMVSSGTVCLLHVYCFFLEKRLWYCSLFNSRPHLLSRLLLRSYFFFTSSNFFSLYHFAAFSTFCVKSF